MKTILYLLFISSLLNTIVAQEIPEQYLGKYSGELKMYNPEIFNKIDMELEITRTDTVGNYNYIIKYYMETDIDIRTYNLIALDSTNGRFTLDENNGINIPTTYINHTLQSFFKVQNNLLATKLSFQNNAAHYEISIANTKKTDSTETFDGQFKVLGYPIGVYHSAFLKKD